MISSLRLTRTGLLRTDIKRLHKNQTRSEDVEDTRTDICAEGYSVSTKWHVSRCGLAVRRQVGKQKDLGSIRFGSPFPSKIVVYRHCLVTLPTALMTH